MATPTDNREEEIHYSFNLKIKSWFIMVVIHFFAYLEAIGKEITLVLAIPTAIKGPESRSWVHHCGDQP